MIEGAGLLLLALALQAPAQQDPAPSAPDVVIVHVNDLHGQVRAREVVLRPGKPPVQRGGLVALARHVEARRERHGDRLWLTNGGDWFQGTPEGNEDRGVSFMACFERLHPTASVLGNHEYDFGERQLMALLDTLRHPVLGANVLERGTLRLRPYVRPYAVKVVTPTTGGGPVRVAMVGLVTSDTPNVSTGPFGSAEFADELDTLERLWPALERDADHVVLLTHCGVDSDRAIAKRFPGIALILGGHSHTALRRPLVEGETTIVQSGSSARAVTELELRLRPDAFEVAAFRFVDIDPADGVSAGMQREIDDRFAAVVAAWDRPIGTLRGAKDRRRTPGSTPGGNLVAGLIRASGKADVGLTNKGGLRTVLEVGPITRRAVFEFLPFDNSVVTFELTGAELIAVIAQGLRSGRQPLEIDGGVYAYEIVDGQRRLLTVDVAGRRVKATRRYRVATNSFLADGGDGFSTFASAVEVGRSPKMLREMLMGRLRTDGVIELIDDQRIRVVRQGR